MGSEIYPKLSIGPGSFLSSDGISAPKYTPHPPAWETVTGLQISFQTLNRFESSLFCETGSEKYLQSQRDSRDAGYLTPPPRKYFKKIEKEWHVFQDWKSTMQDTTIHHKSTTTSPQLHHELPRQNTPESAKPPAKTTSIPLPTFFRIKTAN